MQVDTLHPLEIYAPAPVTIINTGKAAVYYRAEPLVSASLHDGELAAGASVTVMQTTWFIAAAPGAQIDYGSPHGNRGEPYGSASLGADGTVGGTGGSPLSSSVVIDSAEPPRDLDTAGIAANDILVFDGTTIVPLSNLYEEAATEGQAARLRTDRALWVLPTSGAVDAFFARAFDNSKSSLEVEGALTGPGTGRVMGIVVWDQSAGSLVFQIGAEGDLYVLANRHLINGPGSGTEIGQAPTVASAAQNGSGAPAPTLASNSSDMRGSVCFGTGEGAAAGRQVAVTFGREYVSDPFVIVCAANPETQGILPYVDAANTVTRSGFTISTGAVAAKAPASTYAVSYVVIG